MNKLTALLMTVIFASAVNVNAYAADAAPALEKSVASSTLEKATHIKDAKHKNKKHRNEHNSSKVKGAEHVLPATVK